MHYSIVTVALASVAFASTDSKFPPGCAHELCLWGNELPTDLKPIASTYCESVLQTTPQGITVISHTRICATSTVTPKASTTTTTVTNGATDTQTATLTRTAFPGTSTVSVTVASTSVIVATEDPTVTITLPPVVTKVSITKFDTTTSTVTDHSTVNITATATIDTTCTGKATQTVTAPVQARAVKRKVGDYRPRSISDSMPDFFSTGCNGLSNPHEVQKACSCFLGACTATVTQTGTDYVTVTASRTTVTATLTITTTEMITTITTNTITATAPTKTNTFTITVLSTSITTDLVTLTAPVATLTSTVTVSYTTVTYVTSTSTTRNTLTSTTTSCTSTVNPTVTVSPACGAFSSAPSASTSATKTCSNTVASPSANSLIRIEGGSTTVFEGCAASGPMNITTAAGGTHPCTGTNNNANPSQYSNGITQIAAAANISGFTYDGSFSSQFDDFFITRIGTSDSNTASNEFWGILLNEAFTPAGGCETEVYNGQRLLWAFNAFNVNYFLTVYPDSYAATAGSGSITITVNGHDGNSDPAVPISGASIAGHTTDSNGHATIPIPSTPGCYAYKATRSDSIRSNTLYLAVYAAFA